MKRLRRAPSAPPESASTSEDRAALALRQAEVLLAPVARWLLRSGVSYGALARLLKPVFVEAAREELARTGVEPTYSALSVLSGVHRKDVRAICESPQTDPASARPHGVPLASQVYTRWLTSRRYRDRDGQPRSLPRSGPGITFESLSREVSVDVHPRTVMEELMRLGLVELEGDVLVARQDSFLPDRRIDELTALFAANAADHMAAAVHNLTLDAPRYLEQSVFADGLGEASVEALHMLARQAWQGTFEEMVAAAGKRVAADAELPEDRQQRMRVGMYFYSEPQNPAAPALVEAPKATTRRPRKGTKT